MKKLLSLVLICAMGLGMVSCVESEESPSVENIRNAKAKQLEALAELAKAQAEAAKITANAEAALLNAQAEYQKEMTKEAAEKFAVEIEKIKAQAEAAILKAQMNAEKHMQDMQTNANTHIQALFAAYNQAVNKLANANSKLIAAKAEVVGLENGIITAELVFNRDRDYYEEEIAYYEAVLKIYKDPKYTDVNKDSLLNAYYIANQKYKLEKEYFNKSEVSKAANEAYENAKLAAGEFKTMSDEVSAKSSNLLLVDKDKDNDWDYKQLNSDGSIKSTGSIDIVKSITISEVKVNEHKNNLASSYKTAVETYETAQEELDNAKAVAETAKAYAAEMVPAADTNKTATLALALAWEDYSAIATRDAEVERLEGELEDLEEELEELVEAQDEAQDKLTEIGNIQPDLKVLTDAAAAAKATYEDKVEAVTAANEVVTEATDAWKEAKADAEEVKAAKGETSVEYAQALVLVAQANTVVTQAQSAAAEAVAAQTEAKAEWDEAEAEVTAFVAEIAADYPTIDLTGDAEEIAEAIDNAYKKQEVELYNAKKDVVNKTAIRDAKAEELDEAKALVIDPDVAAKAVVDAYATAVETQAAVEAIIKKYEEFIEDQNISINNKDWYDVYDEDNASHTPYALKDEDGNGDPDKGFEWDNGIVFSDTYARTSYEWTPVNIADDFVENYEKAVLKEMDEFTVAKYTFDAINEWMKDPAAAEAAMRAAVDSLNAQIAVVVAAYEAYDEAKAAKDEAEVAIKELEAEKDAIWDMYDSAVELQDKIESAEYTIAYYKNQIEALKSGIYTAEALLEDKLTEIANLEAKIEVLEKMVETAKANLDAAVAAE